MLWMPPVTMNLQPSLPACVVDLPLALSTHGLMSVLQLARATRVWLAPTLWSVIEDEPFYLGHGDFVSRIANGAAEDPESRLAQVRRVIDRWRKARDELGLEVRERLYWPSDKLAESVVPKGGDARLIERMDALSTGLDRRWRRNHSHGAEDVDILADCARDTLALAATLAEERPIVLTTRPGDGLPPEIGAYLDQSGVPCRRLDDATALRLLRSAMAPLLVTAGLVELVAASGLRLVAVSLLTPAAHQLDGLTARTAGGDDLRWNESDSESEDEAALWDSSAALWYELP